ncbi:MAG TPA: hypothetical protein VLF88_01060 [Candidatus Babeliales bacterium]|nr:hypothetical protein [Candidatus Babeliales bacterium]
MEASRFLPENVPDLPTVTCLKEYREDEEPIYHFFVNGHKYEDVGATLEDNGDGTLTYCFDSHFTRFAAADVLVRDGEAVIEWYGSDGDQPPEDGYLLDVLPYFVEAAVRADFEGPIIDDSGIQSSPVTSV